MKIKHKLWPVSYVASNGVVVHTLYPFEPVGDEYRITEPFEVEAEHFDGSLDAAREARITKLRDEIRALEKER